MEANERRKVGYKDAMQTRGEGARPRLMVAVLTAALLAACQSGPATTGAPEARLNGARAVKILARTFVLRTPDGRPVRGAAVLVGGKIFRVGEDGQLALPAAELARARAEGSIVLVSEDFAPVRIRLEGSPDEITLRPLAPLGPAGSLGPAGGQLRSSDGATAVAFPPKMTGEEVDVTLSTYVPPTDGREAWYEAERKGFTSGLPQPTGTPRPNGGTACDQPLPCPPPKVSIGLQVRADGPLDDGVLKVTYDLEAWRRGWNGQAPEPWVADPGAWTEAQIAQAKAAVQLQATLKQIDATGDPAWRAQLAARYGLTYDGQRLTFDVPVGAKAGADGLVRLEVEVFALLGVQLEVTVVSAKTALPPEVGGGPGTGGASPFLPVLPGFFSPPPGTLPVVDPIISDQGGNVISTGGNGVISTGGNGIVSNNGGGFQGHVMSPLEAVGGAKYRLFAYTEVPLPEQAEVDAVDLQDASYGPTDLTNAASDYDLAGLPGTPALVFLRATAGAITIRALAPAPGAARRTADMNTATTAITAWVLDELRTGRATLGQIDFTGYATDVGRIPALLNQAEAVTVATADVPTVATLVREKFRTAGFTPATLPQLDTFAGSGAAVFADGTGPAAGFNDPVSMAIDAGGRLLVADGGNHRLRAIDPAGVTTTLAGTGTDGIDDGPAASATFSGTWGVAVAPTGDIYVADHFAGSLRRLAAGLPPTDPGYVTTLVGNGTPGTLVDGPAASARSGLVAGVGIGPGGEIYFADNGNHAIRKLSGGVVSTLAGSTTGAMGHVDGPGAAARFSSPSGLTVDGAGNVLVADRDNHAIRHITPAGVVTTLAGGTRGYLDAQGRAARFDQPRGVAVDAAGGVYVADSMNHRIRRILPDTTVVTVAGSGGVGAQDGDPAQATFNTPRGVWVGPDGTVYVADSSNHKIRRLR